MPWDGNGNWSSNFSAVADRDANIKILATRFDNILLDDIAETFGNCITRDGQGKTTTNFNANNYRVINVEDPVNNKDAVNKQTVDAKDSLCVHLAGSETITGNKTFSGTNTFSGTTNMTGTKTLSGQTNITGPLKLTGTLDGSAKIMGVPNWSGAVNILTSNGSYTVPNNGYIYIYTGGNYQYFDGNISGVEIHTGGGFASYHENDTSLYPVAKGDVVVRTGASATIKYIPCKQ